MSVRPKARSPVHEQQPGGPEALDELDELDELEELEELGDEAIIAQQTAAHALQPRANVAEESRSVVITEHPERRDSQPPRNPPPRSSAEATLVIRDRRALDEMRQKIVRRQQQKKAHGRRTLYLWGALGLAAFLLGGTVAFLATETGSESEATDDQAQATRGAAALPAQPPTKPAASGSGSPPHAVRLDELPVERSQH